MRIGILSDSHDNLPLVKEAVDFFRKSRLKAILHAGDIISPFSAKALAVFPGKIFAVFGNCDGERQGLSRILKGIQAPPLRIELEGRRLLLLHDLDKIAEEDRQWADAVIFGHTHRPVLKKGTPLFVNPGETGGWLTGIPSVGILDLKALTAEILSLEDGIPLQVSPS